MDGSADVDLARAGRGVDADHWKFSLTFFLRGTGVDGTVGAASRERVFGASELRLLDVTLAGFGSGLTFHI